MRDSLSLPVSFSDEEIAALAPKPGPDGKSVLPSQQVVENIIANAPKSGRPVYFAVTVGKDMTGPYADRLVLEGLVNRVAEGKRSAAVDLDRLTQNLTKNYHLDWPAELPPWPQNMSPLTRMVAPLALNYAAAFVQMASLDDSLGRKDEAAAAWSEAVDWIVRGGSAAVARDYVNAWLARDPVNAVAQRLKARLERAGAAR